MEVKASCPCPKTQAAVEAAVKAGLPLATILALLAALGQNLPAILVFIKTIQDIINPPKLA